MNTMIYSIRNDEIQISVTSSGAELLSIQKAGHEYLWQGEPAFWKSRSPVLFPIVGRLPDDCYRYEGKTYRLEGHGFAKTSEFVQLEESAEILRFSLESSPETLKLYPRRFRLEISYRLHGNTLETEYAVHNPGKETMPFSIGGHPGFNCPLEAGFKKEDYILTFSKAESAQRLENVSGYLTGQSIPLPWKGKELRLGDIEMPPGQLVVILKELHSKEVKLHHPDSDKSVTMEFSQFPYIGFWPVSDAPFLCLEPWQGLTSTENFNGEFTEKEGMRFLEPGESYRAAWRVKIGGHK